jgi:hypothetical protein
LSWKRVSTQLSGECRSHQWITTFAPGIEAALQRTNALDAFFSEEQRHTGARGFVGSSTVQNDFTVERQRVVFFFKVFRVHPECAGDGFGIGFEIYGMAKVDDDEFLASVDLFLQLINGNAGDAQLAKESLAGDEFIRDVRGERPDEEDDELTAKSGRALGDALDLAAEHIAQAQIAAGPEECPEGIVEEKAPRAHVKDAGERRGHRAEAGNKLGEEKRTRTLLGEDAFRPADTRVRLKRNLAKKLKDPDAFEPAELKPEGVGSDGSQDAKKQRGKKTKPSGTRQGACGKQERHSRDGQTDLLGEDPAQEYYVSMAKKEIE